jgi:hypothetical protein
MEDAHFTETEKARKVGSNVKTMLFVFSMFEESSTGNSFLLDRL